MTRPLEFRLLSLPGVDPLARDFFADLYAWAAGESRTGRHPDRLVFQGILFVLHTGVAWEHLPQELGFDSGMTCWRRLAEWTGRSPVDRGRTGSKHHLITDATGIPLAATLTGGNRNDVTQLIPLLQTVPPVRASEAGPGAARMWCWATAATTTTSTAASFGISA